MIKPLLLCCDLDRTVLPNGLQKASPEAMPLFCKLSSHPQITLAYVTGRSLGLTQKAITNWQLPLPAVAATDVGSTIYTVGCGQAWENWSDWQTYITKDWNGHTVDEIATALNDIPHLTKQPEDRQTNFKLCYFAPSDSDGERIKHEVLERLSPMDVNAEVIWSVDETIPVGLIDIVPARATKQGAVSFLMTKLGFDQTNTLFAGDSGNDLPVITGPLKSILVANASPEVRATALQHATDNKNDTSLYIAQGGFKGMNGMYTAGILEGINHFFPEVSQIIT